MPLTQRKSNEWLFFGIDIPIIKKIPRFFGVDALIITETLKNLGVDTPIFHRFLEDRELMFIL